VDLRCGVTALSARDGRLTGAELSDGTGIEADIAVVALGAIRNANGWPNQGSLPAHAVWPATPAAARSVCTASSPTMSSSPVTSPASPLPLFEYQMLSLEHWGNAVVQAEVATHNMINPGPLRRPHLAVPAFSSSQFGLNIKSVGVPIR
jgi:3-phenylpropionate/trans-cinnamate dioxygenase ferredoxin reductase component